MKYRCSSCKEFEPFLKRSKGILRVTSQGSCKLRERFTIRTNSCKEFVAEYET